MLSIRTPFRVKLALVWVVITLIVVALFMAADFDIEWMIDQFWFIATGLPWTIIICGLAILLAVILALLGALGRLSNSAVAQGVSGFYTSFFRGTPLIVQMFLIFLALPQMAPPNLPGLRDSLTLTALQAGVIALGLNYGAYMTEIFRAGIQAVPRGQREAAQALGMPEQLVMRRIVLPQAVRIVVPAVGNEFIAMIKDSALVSIITVQELLWRAQRVGQSNFRTLETLLLAALVYWMLTLVFSIIQDRLEKRMAESDVRL
jgi:polar amino acid transport system permease protein